MSEVIYIGVNLTSQIVSAWLSSLRHSVSLEVTTTQLRDYVTGIKMGNRRSQFLDLASSVTQGEETINGASPFISMFEE